MSCRDFDVLVSLRAAGALDADEEARLDAHLGECAACRAQADELAAVLSLAALPPPSDAERRVLRDLPGRAVGAARRSLHVRSLAKRTLVVVGSIAAAAAVVLAPALLRRDGGAQGRAVELAWSPDLDAIWNDTSVVDLGSSAVSDGSEPAPASDDTDADAAVAALDL